MDQSDFDVVIWLQNDAAYLYHHAALCRDEGNNFSAEEIQRNAAHSSRSARQMLDSISIKFEIAGGSYTMGQMLAANEDDPDVCEWIYSAQVGDVCPLGGETVRRVA